MSRRLALQMAQDEHFRNFNAVAHARNTAGTACRKPLKCAAQPSASHMWHHEDAGIGYNVFRAAIAANTSTLVMALPAHYNDPAIIERSEPLNENDEYWSSRSLFVHGIKIPKQFEQAKQRWNLSRADAALDVRCHTADDLPRGVNAHYGRWHWARVPCPPGQGTAVGDFCPVAPRDHFSFCSFPWVIPPEISAAARARAGKGPALDTPRRRRRGKGKGKGKGSKGKGRGRLTRARKAAMDNMDV